MNPVSSLLNSQLALPLVHVDTVREGVAVAEAIFTAGWNSIEVVLRTKNSLDALSEIKRQFPEITVGAGTVLNTEIYDKACEAGADFIVTPTATPTLLKCCHDGDIPVLPGVMIPSDIAMVLEHGFSEMKLFPAELAGGIAFLSAISDVFHEARFCPTGGINADNMADYLALKNVFAVGGSWLASKQWVEQGQWGKITEACVAAKAIV